MYFIHGKPSTGWGSPVPSSATPIEWSTLPEGFCLRKSFCRALEVPIPNQSMAGVAYMTLV